MVMVIVCVALGLLLVGFAGWAYRELHLELMSVLSEDDEVEWALRHVLARLYFYWHEQHEGSWSDEFDEAGVAVRCMADISEILCSCEFTNLDLDDLFGDVDLDDEFTYVFDEDEEDE